MNPKIEKIEIKIDKKYLKIDEIKKEIEVLTKEKTRLEDLDIISLVRSAKLDVNKLPEFIDSRKNEKVTAQIDTQEVLYNEEN